jgi:hypothetical protein
MAATGFSRQVLLVMSGLIVWAVHFLVVYPFNALACARNFATFEILGIGILPVAIVIVTLLSLGLIGAALLAVTAGRAFEQPEIEPSNGRFLRALTIGIGLLSAVAVIWETIPVFMVPPCG